MLGLWFFHALAFQRNRPAPRRAFARAATSAALLAGALREQKLYLRLRRGGAASRKPRASLALPPFGVDWTRGCDGQRSGLDTHGSGAEARLGTAATPKSVAPSEQGYAPRCQWPPIAAQRRHGRGSKSRIRKRTHYYTARRRAVASAAPAPTLQRRTSHQARTSGTSLACSSTFQQDSFASPFPLRH
ncbi:hypothetical protein FA09DRAFT_270650 [Tilletiopsis washingtonensis]|uniref:Uncharacterized protein n=1 Tax=Tilletiopsis washingtonensis TaxID=58919 RepID=A0A316ZC43_9BASI|nr:hypothetical protein FA09DRAFT_270650 [Tilletiopsis washingtonensis]PWN98608.1 hypothetical protein FA09DRAFT_270650 [Tilletiopsis washingtonensis]